MSAILPLFYFLLFSYGIYKSPFFKSTGLSFRILIFLFVIKVCASFALYFIYTRYYPIRVEADLFKYFDDAQVIYSSIKHSWIDYIRLITGIDNQNPSLDTYYSQMHYWTNWMFNDNQIIIRINAVMMLFSFGNIFVHNIFAAFISLISYLFLYKVFNQFNKKVNYPILISVFLIPSSLFWTSSILKECVLMFGLSIFFYNLYVLIYNKFSLPRVFYFFIGIIVLLNVKIYIVIILMPIVLSFILTAKTKFRPIYIYASFFIISIVLIYINEEILHVFPFLESLKHRRNDYKFYSNAQSFISIGFLDSTIHDFLFDTPISFYRGLFLPWIWNIRSSIEFIPAFENLLQIILLIFVFIFPKKQNRESLNLILFSFSFSIALIWLIGITTPVIGAIVRYKVPIFPFLYTIFAMLIDWQKVLKLLRFKLKNGNSIV